jgi:hypothetical protein
VDECILNTGLDAVIRTDIGADATKPIDTNDSAAFELMARDIGCYFGKPGSDGTHPKTWDKSELWFQVYDYKAYETITAGAVTPYTFRCEQMCL